MSFLVALTGTPGTGKSIVARALRGRLPVDEVGTLALSRRCGKRVGRTVHVDLAALARSIRRSQKTNEVRLLVGHLAHFLPVRDIIVLRCHPVELARRLEHSRRATKATRRTNEEAEATDVILIEVLGRSSRPRGRLWEVDTTHRSPPRVATEILRLVTERPRSQFGTVDWLSDPRVTEHLLAYERSRGPHGAGALPRASSTLH